MKIDIFNTDKKYNIIYADPPWEYKLSGGIKNSRGMAKQHYQTMSTQDISKLPIRKLCTDNAVIFMWATFPNIAEAIKLMQAWGFNYKTAAFVWIKKNKNGSNFWGMGAWTRANAEICIIATKGKPKRESKSVHQVIFSRIEEHSKKPDETRDRIVKLCGDVPRIELFARQSAEGWDCWGLEAPDDKKNI